MKKNNTILIISFALNILLIGDMLYFGNLDTALIRVREMISKTTYNHEAVKLSPSYRVAVMAPISHPSLEEIANGFKTHLNASVDREVEYTVFNGNGDRTLMRSQTEDAVTGGYDLICTLGATCSQLAKETTDKKGYNVPVVFAAVSNPNKLGLLGTGNVTGAIEVRDHKTQLAILKYLKPDTKRILLAYNPAQDPQLERDKNEIAHILEDYGIELKAIEVYQTNEILQKVAPEIAQSDVLLILKDNTMVSSLDALVKLCNRYEVTLYASDLDSTKRGVPLAFGVEEKSFGKVAAEQAVRILVDGKSPGNLAPQPVSDFKLQFNPDTFDSQSLLLDNSLWFLIKNSLVYEA